MLNIPTIEKKRVVVIGGGFGGLKFATELKNSPYQVVMLDRNNYHQFQPLFYQVATSGIEPSAILFPFRKIFNRYHHFHLRIADVLEIMPEEKRIRTVSGNCFYDYLVLANGATTSFFGLENVKKVAHPMKSVVDAITLRNSILENMEKALLTDKPEEKEPYMNIVVVGGGPTGTEIAGALAEMKKHIFPKEYKELEISKIRIIVIEGSPTLVKGMSEKSSAKSKEYLLKLGVEVYNGSYVKDYIDNSVVLSNGQRFPSKTVIWAAGVRGNKINGLPDTVWNNSDRIIVDEYNRIIGMNDAYALGDVCCMQTTSYPNGHPQVAQVAIQQAKNLAKNFKRMAKNAPLKSFDYKNYGTMATIGRHLAVVDLPFIKIRGFFAWFIWMFIHLIAILGVRNKVIVFINWLWSYFTFDQSLRLIIRQNSKKIE